MQSLDVIGLLFSLDYGGLVFLERALGGFVAVVLAWHAFMVMWRQFFAVAASVGADLLRFISAWPF